MVTMKLCRFRHHCKFSSLYFPNLHRNRPFTSQPSPSRIPPAVTPHELQSSILNSQWHFIEHLADSLNPSLISATLLNLRAKPNLVSKFIERIELRRLDLESSCLALVIVSRLPSPKPALELAKRVLKSRVGISSDILSKLDHARKKLSVDSSISFDFMIRGLCQLKKAEEAFKCLKMMKNMGILPKVETCNDMLSLFLRLNSTEMAWVLYAEMFRLKISSNSHTFNIMINVLCKEGKLKSAMEFVGFMEAAGFKPNVVTYNTIINGYCSKGKIEHARNIMGEMKIRGIYPDSYTYGSIIRGLCKEGRLDEAVRFLDKTVESGFVPTAVTYNALIDGYCNKGDLEKAFGFRDEMVKKGIEPNLSTYNMLMHTLFMDGKDATAESLIKEMREKGMKLDDFTYNILINGYCQSGNVKKALELLDEMLANGIQPTKITYTSLIHVRDEMFNIGFNPTRLTYNALIQGLCKNKEGGLAEELLKEMVSRGITPDDSTYISLIEGIGDVEDQTEPNKTMREGMSKPTHDHDGKNNENTSQPNQEYKPISPQMQNRITDDVVTCKAEQSIKKEPVMQQRLEVTNSHIHNK
ncbi:hypothetical protein Cgig2_020086 [Carnegiea gigantea]|uniref:Pentatricopeptide repeat-containing protein n=1 Tax=Carnegiea gigantea TaxID=171969 RepID=A0A9Q1KD49_9CARY|nr:hypothetical protein Cgig2_020086 [Carnegiea gigantea]